MASGIIRLNRGVKRPLTRHEIARGYIYVSRDKHLNDLLNIENFTVEIAKQTITDKRLDVSGRVHIPRTILEAIGLKQHITIKVASKTKLAITSG